MNNYVSTLIVSATKQPLSRWRDLPLIRSLLKPIGALEWNDYSLDRDTPVSIAVYNSEEMNYVADIALFTSNKKGLSDVYNRTLKELSDPLWVGGKGHYEQVIFVHDDVRIQHPQMIPIIHKQFDGGYAVVGLAGSITARVEAPALWHLMSRREEHSGSVAHPCSADGSQVAMTYFGPSPMRCLLLDGLFLAVDPKKLKQRGVTFDEQFMFHHYDLDFCLSCNAAGLKMTTAPIWCTHESPGLENYHDLEFQKSQKLFLDKWAKVYSQ